MTHCVFCFVECNQVMDPRCSDQEWGLNLELSLLEWGREWQNVQVKEEEEEV